MANYDYQALTLAGVYEHVNKVRARIGNGLFRTIVKYKATGVPADALDTGVPAAPLPALLLDTDIHLEAAAGFGNLIHPPLAANDWSDVNQLAIDLMGSVYVTITDPNQTDASPCPQIAQWATALGGTVDESGGL